MLLGGGYICRLVISTNRFGPAKWLRQTREVRDFHVLCSRTFRLHTGSPDR